MRKPVRLSRPQRQPLRLERTELAKPVARAVGVSQNAVVVSRAVARLPAALPVRTRPPVVRPMPPPAGFEPDPYVDYGRFLTPEGGILLVYKDIDERLRHTIWRLFAWSVTTGIEALLIFHHSPLESPWIGWACLLVAALINWLIVAAPVEIYRTIEIRSDCLILDGAEVFWRRFMESWPALQQDQQGHQILVGVYGTRQVEFATIRRFDEQDRMPEVFAAHLQDAFRQLWTAFG